MDVTEERDVHCAFILQHNQISAIAGLSFDDPRAVDCVACTLDKRTGPIGKFFVVYGRVPMFYYVIHIYVVHAAAVLAGFLTGYDPLAFFNLMFNFPQQYGFGLPVVYLVWMTIVLGLYPACKWYSDLKQRRKDPWLSYL